MKNRTSEVAALRQRIAEECEAGWRALYELGSGMAQHQFILARFQRMERYHQRLAELVGKSRQQRFCAMSTTRKRMSNEPGCPADEIAPLEHGVRSPSTSLAHLRNKLPW
jgi:hypothetical protein